MRAWPQRRHVLLLLLLVLSTLPPIGAFTHMQPGSVHRSSGTSAAAPSAAVSAGAAAAGTARLALADAVCGSVGAIL